MINDGGRIRRNSNRFSNYRAISANQKHFQIILSVDGAVGRRNVNIEIANKKKIRINLDKLSASNLLFSSSMHNLGSEDG